MTPTKETVAQILLRVGVRWQEIKDLDIADDTKGKLLSLPQSEYELNLNCIRSTFKRVA